MNEHIILASDNEIFTFRYNEYGQLGSGYNKNKNNP